MPPASRRPSLASGRYGPSSLQLLLVPPLGPHPHGLLTPSPWQGQEPSSRAPRRSHRSNCLGRTCLGTGASLGMVWYLRLDSTTCMQSPHFECSWTDRHPTRGVQEQATEMTIELKKGKHLSHSICMSPCGVRNKQPIAAFPRAVHVMKAKGKGFITIPTLGQQATVLFAL